MTLAKVVAVYSPEVGYPVVAGPLDYRLIFSDSRGLDPLAAFSKAKADSSSNGAPPMTKAHAAIGHASNGHAARKAKAGSRDQEQHSTPPVLKYARQLVYVDTVLDHQVTKASFKKFVDNFDAYYNYAKQKNKLFELGVLIALELMPRWTQENIDFLFLNKSRRGTRVQGPAKKARAEKASAKKARYEAVVGSTKTNGKLTLRMYGKENRHSLLTLAIFANCRPLLATIFSYYPDHAYELVRDTHIKVEQTFQKGHVIVEQKQSTPICIAALTITAYDCFYEMLNVIGSRASHEDMLAVFSKVSTVVQNQYRNIHGQKGPLVHTQMHESPMMKYLDRHPTPKQFVHRFMTETVMRFKNAVRTTEQRFLTGGEHEGELDSFVPSKVVLEDYLLRKYITQTENKQQDRSSTMELQNLPSVRDMHSVAYKSETTRRIEKSTWAFWFIKRGDMVMMRKFHLSENRICFQRKWKENSLSITTLGAAMLTADPQMILFLLRRVQNLNLGVVSIKENEDPPQKSKLDIETLYTHAKKPINIQFLSSLCKALDQVCKKPNDYLGAIAYAEMEKYKQRCKTLGNQIQSLTESSSAS